MDATTKRIDATLMKANQKKLVRIIGKCESSNTNATASAVLIANGPVHLDLSAATSENGEDSGLMTVNKFYEIVGKVSSNPNNLKVHVYSVIELGDDLNVEAAEKLVLYSQKVPELFCD
ncbi:uncharacterized protein LODBEIA_P06140 [Lodderomyces beijingensis]|uniref:Replication factor A protein 3 n=1 Tax=Lodderomyces beijingensis TaxID=1775926 RepID=A0ABP0ZJ81_9ASCO